MCCVKYPFIASTQIPKLGATHSHKHQEPQLLIAAIASSGNKRLLLINSMFGDSQVEDPLIMHFTFWYANNHLASFFWNFVAFFLIIDHREKQSDFHR